MKEKIKFKEAGKWADPNPALPQVSVEKDEKVDVSIALAKIVIDAGKGTRVSEKSEKVESSPSKVEDKKKSSNQKPHKKDKVRAERK